MSYVLTPIVCWQPAELQAHLTERLRRVLGPHERDRLKYVRCSQFIISSREQEVGLAMSGLKHGPFVQIQLFVGSGPDENQGLASQTVIPQRIRWSDIERTARQLDQVVTNMLKRLRRKERAGLLRAVVNTSAAQAVA